MSPARRTHAQARAEMREGILRLGREQLAIHGAAGLSFREIARGLRVAPSAVYRHVSSRDELLTLLLVDAFSELADQVDLALNELKSDPDVRPAAELSVLSHCVRQWAVLNPARWALLYGTPVPGYSALHDDTNEVGTRVLIRLLEILVKGSVPSRTLPVSSELSKELEDGIAELSFESHENLVVMAAEGAIAWSGLVGTISAEIFEQLGSELSAFGCELLDRWIDSTAKRFSL